MATKKTEENQKKITSVVAREGNGNIQLTFTIPFEIIKHAQDETIQEFAKDVEVPGFRKGNAPLNKVAEKIPQNTLIEHSLSHILPVALSDSIEENKLKLAIYPKFELVSAKEGEDWQIRAITCELPEVVLGDYKKAVEGSLRAAAIALPGKEAPKAEEKEQAVVKALLENVKVEVPQILIEEEANSRLSSLLNRLEKLGLALENYLASIGKKSEDLRAEYATQAKEAISLDLILSKVAESENITVDAKELESALNMSEATRPQDTSEEVESRKRLLESILKRRKALDLLMKLS